MRAPERTRQLSALSPGIVVDDFGTEYSSLSHVRELAVDGLKVDRSFASRLGGDRRDEAIVTTNLTLGDTLNLPVIAEGVETAEQLRWLREPG